MQLFDFKKKALNLHDLTIQMNVSALTGLTGTSIQARYSTAYSWISRIEILLNNQVHDTIYPETRFLLQNLFKYDEDRTFCSNMAGNYASITQRASLFLFGLSLISDMLIYFTQKTLRVM
jgi:hypothetical protein